MRKFIFGASLLLGILLTGCTKENEQLPDPVLESISLDVTELTMEIGDTHTFTVETEPADMDVTLTWQSSNPDIASVEDGTVTANSAGEATVTVSSGEISATCDIIVNKEEEEEPTTVEVESVTVEPSEISIMVGETVTLEATVEPADAEYDGVSWTSSDPETATVDENGVVTGVAEGNAVITAKAGEKTAECAVTVTPIPVESITVEPSTLTLIEGETQTLTATVLPENAGDKTITWSSSDENVATVSETGTVTAVKAGNTVITAKAGEKTAECAVTVNAPAPAIPVNVGDYFYSDGTWSTEINTEKTVIGVVFYAGDITAEDPTLASDHPGCTHGLVVSLGDINSPDGTIWQTNGTDLNSWAVSNGYQPINDANKANGYNNTKALEAFNEANSDNYVGIAENISEYRITNPAPANTSSWYMPSAKEWALLTAGEFEGDVMSVSSQENRNKINEVLETVIGGESIIGGGFMGWELYPKTYWSSTETDASQSIAYLTEGTLINNTKESYNYTRAVLAF